MQPLSPARRKLYVIVSFCIFFFSLPFVILYSKGFRIADDFTLVETGGLYVDVPYSDVNIYIDGKLRNTTTFFDRDYFVQNLLPEEYRVSVWREGLRDWEKWVAVSPQRVSSVFPILIPETLEARPIVPATAATTTTSTSTRVLSENAYETILQSFAQELATTTALGGARLATTTFDGAQEQNDLLAYLDGGKLYAQYFGGNNQTPYYFCLEFECVRLLLVRENAASVDYFDFYPNREDALLVLSDGAVSLVELDVRPGENAYVLAEDVDAFRVVEGEFIIQRGARFFEIELEA